MAVVNQSCTDFVHGKVQLVQDVSDGGAGCILPYFLAKTTGPECGEQFDRYLHTLISFVNESDAAQFVSQRRETRQSKLDGGACSRPALP
jgi:hypothetical protein